MDKENNRSAAGLRRSAIAERLRLREEWSALKGTDEPTTSNPAVKIVFKKQSNNPTKRNNDPWRANVNKAVETTKSMREHTRITEATSDVLRGVVALVEVGAEFRALALRAALSALGATVVPTWSPLVTHLIWAQGGCRGTRAKARALASWLISPLWVEACAASAKRLPEVAFPAAARPSDIPSPKTLRRLLKQAEMENIPIADLLSDSNDDNGKQKLRISSDTDHDTSADRTTDTSRDTSHDMSRDTSKDKSGDTTGIESRVNTAPRRALPHSSVMSPKPAKSKRKLFTYKEAEIVNGSTDESDQEKPVIPKPMQPKPKQTKMKVTQKDRKDLARAERMARKLVAECAGTTKRASGSAAKPRIVLTGMGRTERQSIYNAITALNGRVQAQVTKKTTHVLLGSCRDDIPSTTNQSVINHRAITSINNCNITGINTMAAAKIPGVNMCNITGISTIGTGINTCSGTGVPSTGLTGRSDQKARTLNALAGAARGCRVLYAQWAIDSVNAKKWIHHHGYEVPHLKKICQKARVERAALGRLRSEYAYDVFYGMRVRVTPNAEQKDAAIQLLKLCGAIVQESQNDNQKTQKTTQKEQNLPKGILTQNGAVTQNGFQDGGTRTTDFDITIGVGEGEIASKWVFDSVAAARMRTTRRYINKDISNSIDVAMLSLDR